MSDFLGSILGGIGSFIGGERRNDAADEQADQAMQFSAEQAKEARDFSAQQAQMQRDYQSNWADVAFKYQREMTNQAQGFNERMANTAYQRQMYDMKQAGLNPILAYTKAGGAAAPNMSGSSAPSSPSGAMATSPSPSGINADMADTISPAIQTGFGIYKQRSEVANLEAQVGERNANTLLVTANAGRTAAEIENLRANTAHVIAQIPNEEIRRQLMGAQAGQAAAGADQARALADQIRQQMRILEQAGRPGFDPGSLLSQLDAALRQLQGWMGGNRNPRADTPTTIPRPANRNINPGRAQVNPIEGF